MTRLSLAKDLKAALKSADFVLVLGHKKALEGRQLPKILPPKAQKMLADLAKSLKSSDQGSAASSLTGGTPVRVTVGVIPDVASRYNIPIRPDAIERLVGGAQVTDHKKPAIIIVLENADDAVAATNAIGRALPQFSLKTKNGKSARVQVAMVNAQGEFITPTPMVREVFRCARDAAELVDAPPTDMNPRVLAERAVEMLDGLGVKVDVIVGDALLEQRLGGIHGVGRAAVEAPRMLVARHAPKTKSKTHVVLVGKGVTFDTGGLHLKPRGSIESMKSDMGGAAAMLGAFRVLVKLGYPHPLSLVLCLAENAIDSVSYKPDDVLTMHSRRTVEINNTDAEGRLLLADGVSYAARDLKATHVFDAATLTGAQMIATGMNHAAIMSNDADLERIALDAAYQCGDLAHPLMFAPEFYKQEFSSKIADMKNSVKSRFNAQSSCAGQFIYNHIDDTNVRWLHIDLAGPSFRNERGTGFGVALVAGAVSKLAEG